MDEQINIDDFKKVEIRIGEVKSAEKIEDSDKLLKLIVNFGDHERQVISGIAKHVDPENVIGRKFAFATNLEPRVIMGLESQAMILATGGDGKTPFAILEAPEAASGAIVR